MAYLSGRVFTGKERVAFEGAVLLQLFFYVLLFLQLLGLGSRTLGTNPFELGLQLLLIVILIITFILITV